MRADGLGKKYRLYGSPHLRLLEWAALGRAKLHRDFWALRGVSFELRSGEKLGVLGMNGAGKSTLLAMLAGILSPDEGRMETAGDVVALLELAAGFHPDFTGRQNVFLAGQLRGLSRRQVTECLDEIIEFAEIGEFIDQPTRTYSSGMLMRLAFSVATTVVPDVLIIDEAISVGDVFFQHKCRRRIKGLTSRGTALVLVTHSTDQVRSICNRGLVLDRGEPIYLGSSQGAADAYLRHIREREAERAAAAASASLESAPARAPGAPPRGPEGFPPAHALGYGSAETAEIINVEVLDDSGATRESFSIDEEVCLRIHAHVKGGIEHFGAAFLVRDGAGIDLLGTTSHHYGWTMEGPPIGRLVVFSFSFPNVLREGHYSISAALNRLADPEDPQSGIVIHQFDNVAGYSSRGLPDLRVYHRVYVPVEVAATVEAAAAGPPQETGER